MNNPSTTAIAPSPPSLMMPSLKIEPLPMLSGPQNVSRKLQISLYLSQNMGNHMFLMISLDEASKCASDHKAASCISLDTGAHLLVQLQYLEAIKIRKVTSLFPNSSSLRPGTLVPLLFHLVLFPSSCYSTPSSCARKFRNDDVREDDVAEGRGMTGDSHVGCFRGSVDESLVVH